MNDKNLIQSLGLAVFWMAAIAQGWAQVTGGPQVGAELKIVDDAGKPIEGADAVISYIGVVPNTGETFRLTSGVEGTVTAKSALNGHVKAKVTKAGYYPAVLPQLLTKGTWDGEALIEAEIILREINDPIALYARKVDLSVPSFGQWIGFDLQKGDWVNPWGQGVVGDLEVHVERKFEGYRMPEEKFRIPLNADVHEEELRLTYGGWSGELKLRVPTEGGGVYLEKEGYQVLTKESLAVYYARLKNWEMRLPHLAPKDGYQGEPLVWKTSYPSVSPPEVDPEIGYFLRSRVKLDSEGEVISANYAKIMTSDAKYHGSDIHFDPRGKISFTYYFNPTANDRNLEFDPEKNLFIDLEDGEKVSLP